MTLLDTAINKNKDAICTGTFEKKKTGIDYSSAGFRENHAYSVMKVFEKNGKKFVQVKDPYGIFLSGYDKNQKIEDKSSKFSVIKDNILRGSSNMGTFNLELKDFLHYFDHINGCSEKTFEDAKNLIPFKEKFEDYKDFVSEAEEIEQAKELDFLEISKEDLVQNDKTIKAKEYSDPQKTVKKNFGIVDEDIETYFAIVDEVEEEKVEKVEEEEEIREEQFSIFENGSLSKIEKSALLYLDSDKAEQDNIKERLEDFTVKDLNDLQKKTEKQLNELKVTKDFFNFASTEKFNTMYKSLETLNNSIKSFSELANNSKKLYKKSEQVSLKELFKDNDDIFNLNMGNLASNMSTARRAASIYLDYKTERVMKEAAKGKTQSDRSMHRIVAAASISNICSFNEPLNDWPSKNAENISIILNDLLMKRNFAKTMPGHSEKELQTIEKTMLTFATALSKDVKLKNSVENKIYPETKKLLSQLTQAAEVQLSEKKKSKTI